MSNIKYYAIGFRSNHHGELQDSKSLYSEHAFDSVKDLIQEIKTKPPSGNVFQYCLLYKLEGIPRVITKLQVGDYENGQPVGLLKLVPVSTLFIDSALSEQEHILK